MTNSKILQELNNVKEELKIVKSLLISLVGTDAEGNYSPGFVKEIFKASKEKPKYSFKNEKHFLAQLQKVG